MKVWKDRIVFVDLHLTQPNNVVTGYTSLPSLCQTMSIFLGSPVHFWLRVTGTSHVGQGHAKTRKPNLDTH